MTPEDRLSKIRALEAEAHELERTCPHELKPMRDPSRFKTDQWYSEGATCRGCGNDFGWRCDKSPDEVCHYYSDANNEGVNCDDAKDRHVLSIRDERMPIPNHDWNHCHETPDCCIFCGHPEERK